MQVVQLKVRNLTVLNNRQEEINVVVVVVVVVKLYLNTENHQLIK